MLNMQSSPAWRGGPRVSVAVVLVATIVCIVTVLLALVGSLAFHYYSAERWRTFEDRHNLAAEQLASALVPPVWNLEYDQIGQIAYSRLRDPDIAGVVVEIDAQRLIFGRDGDGAAQRMSLPYATAGLHEQVRAISFGGERIGTLVLHASSDMLEVELAQTRLYMLMFAFVLDVVLILSLYVVVRRLVIRPLRQVERYADEISHVGDSSIVLDDLRFLGELDGLKRSIDNMVRTLAARNRELERTNARFERVTRQFPLPLRIADNSGRLLLVNECYTATFGYTAEELPDLQAWYDKAYPDDAYRAAALAAWDRAVAHSAASAGRIQAGHFRIVCRDGSVKVVDISGVRFEDITVGVMQDITERVMAEDELTRHREHLEELVEQRTEELAATYVRLEETQFAMDHAGIAIQWYEAGSGRISYVNDHACRLYGYGRDQLLGRPITDLAPAIDASVVVAPSGGEASHQRIETTVRRQDGSALAVEFMIYRQAADAGHEGDYISFATDISQRKEAEQALISARVNAEAAAAARSQFLANMSHEIRTPMNAIIGMTQLALQCELEPRQRNFIQKANAAALSLLGIINDILDFSKIESGNLRVEQVDLDLDRVLDDLAAMLGLKAEEKSLELLFDVAPDVPRRLVGDPLRLTQVLINLVSNAIKFTEHGQVVVRCRCEPAPAGEVLLRFEVEDSGIGIDEAQLAQLFKPFSQGDGSISRRFGGTGLGLTISRHLVELMGGRIDVSSQPGRGSVFAFAVPAVVQSDQTPRATKAWAGLHKSRVLVVDDHPEAREVLATQLASMQAEVECAACARDALAMMRGTPPFDLLITDWHMPGMDGVELVRAIQHDEEAAHPRAIIMVSAFGVDALRVACADVQVGAILPKPASPSTLLEAIQSALGADASSDLPQAGLQPGPDSRSLTGLRILLVEDNPINQELALEMLAREGAEVLTAGDGEQALRQLDRGPICDCVLMDVQMPRMDGLEATRRLRAQARFAALPIIAMTAGALPEERALTQAAGMNDHLVKPIDVDLMLTTILRWCGRGGAGQDVARRGEKAGDAPVVLDLEHGLKLAGGNGMLQRRLLALHAGNSADLVARLRAAVAAGDREALRGLAHRIKGETAVLGATEAQACATRLEACSRECGSALLQAEVAALCAALVRLSARIENFPAPDSGSGVYTGMATLRERIASLRCLLESADADAVEAVIELRACLSDERAEAGCERLAALVEGYAFDQALMELDRLAETWGVVCGAAEPGKEEPR
ncbi:MAG TPA: hybrid sensor histidine kinase/response regulator [Thauera sp.]|nr:hybrid sensor histidine kinase/response regulator [Thauera sp.]